MIASRIWEEGGTRSYRRVFTTTTAIIYHIYVYYYIVFIAAAYRFINVRGFLCDGFDKLRTSRRSRRRLRRCCRALFVKCI